MHWREGKKKNNTRKSLRSEWEDGVFDSTDGFCSLMKSCRFVVSYFSIHFASEMTFSITWFVSVFSEAKLARRSQERENLGMLVWSPNQNLSEAKCKSLQILLFPLSVKHIA